MSLTSIWPSLAITLFLLLLVSTPLLAGADMVPGVHKTRIRSLDGLRGFLALSVFFYHAAIYHGFLATGAWEPPSSNFYGPLGTIGIMMFFMITGYLFWSRLLRSDGRPGWRALYTGRVLRIGPLYLFAFVAMATIALLNTGMHLQVPLRSFLLQLGVGGSLGLASVIDINGYQHTGLLLDGVTWTLQFEWVFYLCLPILAVVVIFFRRWHLLFVSVAFCALEALYVLHSHPQFLLWVGTIFLGGMVCASIQRDHSGMVVPNWAASTVVAALLVVAFYVKSWDGRPSLLPLLLIFYLVSSGCTLFGVLSSKAARRLGDVSYDIYLLQGLTQAVFFRPAIFRSFGLASPMHFWLLTLAAAVSLLLLSVLTHVGIEQPGIRLGARLVGAIRSAPGAAPVKSFPA